MSSISIPSKVWGPGGWKLLEGKFQFGTRFSGSCSKHASSSTCEGDPAYEFLMYIATHLPGSACKLALGRYLRDHRPTPNQDRGVWLTNLHNEVNGRTGKPQISIAEAKKLVWDGNRDSLTNQDRLNIRKFLSVTRFESYHKETEIASAIGSVFDWISLANDALRANAKRRVGIRYNNNHDELRLAAVYANPHTYDLAIIFSDNSHLIFDAYDQKLEYGEKFNSPKPKSASKNVLLDEMILTADLMKSPISTNFAKSVQLQPHSLMKHYMTLTIVTTQKLSCVIGNVAAISSQSNDTNSNACGLPECRRILEIGPFDDNKMQMFIDPTYPLPHLCVYTNNMIHILLLPLCESISSGKDCETEALEKLVNNWIRVSL